MLFKYNKLEYRKINTLFYYKGAILKTTLHYPCTECFLRNKGCGNIDVRAIRGECIGDKRPNKLYVSFALIRRV